MIEYKKIEKPDRIRLFLTATVACLIFAFEIIAYQTINYVNEYLSAIQVISVALMGIALGGLLSFFVKKDKSDRIISYGLILLSPSIILSFFVIAKLNSSPLLMMSLLMLPYMLAGFTISIMFNRLQAGMVYLFDLCGAGLGAVLAVIMIPYFREEGSFFLLALLSIVPLLLIYKVLGASRKNKLLLVIGALYFVVSYGLFYSHIAYDSFNLLNIASVSKTEYPLKAFHFMKTRDGRQRYEIVYSRGNLVERIDILEKLLPEAKGYRNSVYNARFVDIISRERITKYGLLDSRIPSRLKLGENPDTLIVGPSGHGATKIVRSLGAGKIDAVEINSAIANLMTDELYEWSGEAYKDINLTIGDVRTFLNQTQKQYDFITLFNIHRVYSIAHQGPPEYVHTAEAIQSYLDHLKENGFMILEERNSNKRSDLGIRKILLTAMNVLLQSGSQNPSRHIAIWETFQYCKKDLIFNASHRCNQDYRFTFVMIKKTAITDIEYQKLKDWEKVLGSRKPSRRYPFRGIKWQYLPQEQNNNSWTQLVLNRKYIDPWGNDTERYNLATITDDRPFPYDVFKERRIIWRMLKNISLLALLFVLLPAIIIFYTSKKKHKEKEKLPVKTNLLLIAFFSILGLGYLLIEIVLIQKLQIFLSSPVITLVVVISVLLISSGIGGYFSYRVKKKGLLKSLLAVVLLSLLTLFIYNHFLDTLISLHFVFRILFIITTLTPLGFFMGIPFPTAMSHAKKVLSDWHAGLFFGINGAVAGIAVPLSIITSMIFGFNITFHIASAAYLLCLLIFTFIKDSETV